MNYQEELEQLRLANSRLESTVQELKLEISYYKGEAKRLEWEKDVLHQDVKRMSSLFKTWIDEVNKEPTALADSPEKINMMVKYPCRSISELLQLNDEILFITSCQPPYFIEYVNKRWSNECGWNPSEILGLTCSFLQGELTDKGVTRSFMKDIRSVGYAHMRVYNYRKSGEIFEVDVTVYPVFDSICAVGQDAEIAVLTHFASVMTNSKEVTPAMCRQRHGTMSSDPSATSTNPSSEMRSSESNSEVQSSYDRSSHYDSHLSANGSTSNEEGDRLMASGGMMQRMFGVHNHGPVLVDHEWGKTATVPMSVGESLDEKAKAEDKTQDEKANTVEMPLSTSSNPSSKNGTDSDPISTVTDSNPSPNESNRGTDSNQVSDSQQGSDSNPPNGSSETGYSDTSSGLGSDSAGQGTTAGQFVDRRKLDMRFVPKCGILSENFYQFGNTLRLSNLLRLMLSSQDAMALLDNQGRFIHVNVAWSKVTGYELSDVEGLTLSVMEGADTDTSMVQLYQTAMQERRAVEVNLMHYRRSGEKFVDQMTVVPIQGGYMQPNVSHYCALCREVQLVSSSNNSSMTGDSPSSSADEPQSPPEFAMDNGSDQTSEFSGTAAVAAAAATTATATAAVASSPATAGHTSSKRSHDSSESSAFQQIDGPAPATKKPRKSP